MLGTQVETSVKPNSIHPSLDVIKVNSLQGVYCLLLHAKGLHIIKYVGYQYPKYLGYSRL